MHNTQVTLSEAPVYQGQKHYGVTLGPAFIRQLLADQKFNFDVVSCVSAQSTTKVLLNVYEDLSKKVETIVKQEKPVFIVGGDHSLSVGSVQGLLHCYPNLKVLWIDAHADLNTRQSSLTQSFHGMPLSFLLGQDDLFASTSWFSYCLKPENLIYFGIRDLDLAEHNFLDKLKIEHYSRQDILRLKLDTVIKYIQQSTMANPLHVSLDLDAFDPKMAPSTGVPVSDGLSYFEVEKLLSTLVNTTQMVSYEFVELNPQIFNRLEDVKASAQIGIDLFKIILKQQLKQRSPYGRRDRRRRSTKSNIYDSHFEMEI
mgnify:CR=1 FL=1